MGFENPPEPWSWSSWRGRLTAWLGLGWALAHTRGLAAVCLDPTIPPAWKQRLGVPNLDFSASASPEPGSKAARLAPTNKQHSCMLLPPATPPSHKKHQRLRIPCRNAVRAGDVSMPSRLR